MRIGGLIWFVAGYAFCMVVMGDGLGGLFTTTASIVGAIVKVLAALGTFGFIGTLVVLGLGLLFGSRWAERARGKFDADNAWRNRNAYRR